MSPHGVLETCLYMADLDAAERFYTEVIGLTLYSRSGDRHVFFRSDRSMFLVFNPDVTAAEGETPHGARGAGHACFRVWESELESWREHLRAHGVPIEQEIAWPHGGHSVYFRDPNGLMLEYACTTRQLGEADTEMQVRFETPFAGLEISRHMRARAR